MSNVKLSDKLVGIYVLFLETKLFLKIRAINNAVSPVFKLTAFPPFDNSANCKMFKELIEIISRCS